MKRLFLLTIVFFSAICADTNKTFLSPRPVLHNSAVGDSIWHGLFEQEQDPDVQDHSVQLICFFEQNDNENALGKYFGFQNKNRIVIGNPDFETVDVDKRHLYNVPTNAEGETDDFSGTITMDYKFRRGGIRLGYYKNTDHFLKNTFVKVNAPIIFSESKMNVALSDSNTTTIRDVKNPSQELTVSLLDYFEGNLIQPLDLVTANIPYQVGLQKAKLGGTQTRAGLGDIEFNFGWDLTNNLGRARFTHASLNAGFTLPTGPRPSADFTGDVFPGNNGHFAVGFGGDAYLNFHSSDNSKLDFFFGFDFRYLMQTQQERTLGIAGKDWGHYFLMAEHDKRGTFPAANVLTRNVSVTPGMTFDGKAGASYKYDNFIIDLGYNAYLRESERVQLRDFELNTYGVAGTEYDSADTFKQTDAVLLSSVSIGQAAVASGSITSEFLTRENIDTTAAATPSQDKHMAYGALGYIFEDIKYPVMVGAGGSYEFVSNGRGLENWAVWAKASISF